METSFTQQEVLLLKNAGYFSKYYKGKAVSSQQKLEELCFNGMIREVLPELFDPAATAAAIWQNGSDKSPFVSLEVGSLGEAMEKVWSLNPYRFMRVKCLN
ncbi:MAG: hypothetical protein JWQ27_446 [Ferruginibacter sp.]|nr:hypothetical protein [Ferruginibacter sp.]